MNIGLNLHGKLTYGNSAKNRYYQDLEVINRVYRSSETTNSKSVTSHIIYQEANMSN